VHVSDRTDATSERVRFLTRWRWLSLGVRTALVLVVAPLFYLLPLLLRRSGVDEGVALLLGVALAAVIAVVAGIVATRLATTPRPPRD
jgi:hypothetical protein